MKTLIYLIITLCFFITGCSNRGLTGRANSVKAKSSIYEVLFLGNISTHHNSGKYAPMLVQPLLQRGVKMTYTTDTGDINTTTLSKYDGIIIYANYNTISFAKEQVLKEFVEGGKGFIPLHAASACFTNSKWYIQAVGGQFKSHKTAVFSATTVKKDHEVMKGVEEFSSWDETYVHSDINPDKVVLQERVEGGKHEPWTWVRMQGKGRVFYTAGGHNDSTWTNQEFIKLVVNGITWAVDKPSSR